MKEWLKKSANPVDKEDLERHDKWLCMMWPRLCLIRELMAETGSLWMTLDDNEVHRARVLLDEIFGEDCFVTQIVWQKRTSRENRATFSESHDHILVYSRLDADLWKLTRNLLEPNEDGYANPDNDERGPWSSIPFSAQGFRKNQVYSITTPTGKEVAPPRGRCWGATETVFLKLKSENRVYFPRDGDGLPRIKQFKNEAKGLVPSTIWLASEVGDNEESKKEVLSIFDEGIPFDTPKPVKLVQQILTIASKPDSIILDPTAGSGTTAHAVIASNDADRGCRRFIMVECEDYADTLTAERVRRVIKGYRFSGTQRKELLSTKLTWSTLKKVPELLEKVESIERLEGAAFAKVKKEVKDGVLTVTGEQEIQETMPGLGGSFTFCTLGAPINVETLLDGENLPTFESLARYVFYTATGRSLEKVAKVRSDGFIGETELFRLHLFYQPDREWLRSNEAALNSTRAEAVATGNKDGKRSIVFAVAKFMGQRELTAKRIEFCQLPYAIHRILGD